MINEEYKDGVYKSKLAVYYIKGDKIIMRLNGRYYKTNLNFMQGTYSKELSPAISATFDKAYNECSRW